MVFAGAKGEYGNAIVIDHGGGWQTFYSQLSRIEVGVGDCVAFGALIGKVGSTGLSAVRTCILRFGRTDSLDPLSVGVSNEPPNPQT